MTYYVTFRKQNGPAKIGVYIKDNNEIIDLNEAEKTIFSKDEYQLPNTMVELIESYNKFKDKIDLILKEINSTNRSDCVYKEREVKILAPIGKTPKNIIAVGLNYKKHKYEFTGDDKDPNHPIVFSKASTSIIGPNENVNSYPQYTSSLDYEGELGLIIGKKGKDIPKEKAQEYIFGYTIVNDISIRDRQQRTSQWFLGKSMDTHCPIGPYILDRESVDWPVSLDIKTKVNGEVRQNSNTELLIFDIPTIISTVSEGLTLEPGDIITTGTADGTGLGYNPPKYLKKGDKIEVEIEKLGVLKNTVI